MRSSEKEDIGQDIIAAADAQKTTKLEFTIEVEDAATAPSSKSDEQLRVDERELQRKKDALR